MKKSPMALFAASLAVLVTVAFVLAGPSAKAASLVQVTNFGNNPSNLQMYIYVPNSVTANPPILLALHGCQGSGPYMYSSTQFASLADQYGFIVSKPSVTRSYDCWDVTSAQALTRNGGSDPIVAGANAAKCVDDNGQSTANGTKIELWDCNGGANQQWSIP